MAPEEDQARQSQLLVTAIDPLARQILDAVEPCDAYDVANGIPGALLDALDWMPHGGRLYTAWAELTDLFETDKVPLSDAHTALRRAATDWLARSGEPAGTSIEMWLERTEPLIKRLFDRDGTFWGPKD